MITNNKNICVNCGLCCDGTLFSFSNINENEIIDPAFAFETFDNANGKRGFKQGCCYLKNKICTIYDKRPYSICGTFSCKQLKLFTSNSISYDEVMKIINTTIRLKVSIEKDITAEFPAIGARSFYEKMEIFEKIYLSSEDQFNFRKKHARLILDVTQMRLATAKYFYNKKP